MRRGDAGSTALLTDHYELTMLQAALAAGETSEYRARLEVKETAHLTAHDRAAVDAELAAMKARLSKKEG